MSKFESTLSLSVDNLKVRRRQLEEELGKVITEIVTNELKESLKDILKKLDLKISKVTWSFQSEYDDEGGTDWWASDVSAFDEEDRLIDTEDIIFERVSWDKQSTYEVNLHEEISEIIVEYSHDLYSQDITEILL